MRVLQINSVCGTGSTGRIATDIHDLLVKSGNESYIAYGRAFPQNCETSIRIGTKVDNYTHAVFTRIFDKHGFGSRNASLEFINKIDELHPDVIHLHNIHGYYINIEILFNYLKKISIPVVWTLHDCWSFTGHCSHFDYIGCDRWRTECHSCPQKNKYPVSMLFDNSNSNYIKKKDIFTGVNNMTIVTPSEWLAKLVKESFLKEYPTKVINNGIDLEVFKPTLSNFRDKYKLENKFIILGVANVWDERKGYDFFIELSKKIREDEIIVLVGITEKQRSELPASIIGITRTNNIKELAEIYSSADVFVNTTLEEVLGLVNIESLACATPVITFNSGGSPECVDKESGYVVEKGNLSELVINIRRLKENGKQHYSEKCMERAKKMYNKNDNFSEYLNLYSYSYKRCAVSKEMENKAK